MHRNWDDLAKSYDDSANFRDEWRAAHVAMANLCRFIEASVLRTALFGFKSHHELSISQRAYEFPPPLDAVFLKIHPLVDGEIEFLYEDTRIIERQWRRIDQADRTITRFNRFIDQIGWSTVQLHE